MWLSFTEIGIDDSLASGIRMLYRSKLSCSLDTKQLKCAVKGFCKSDTNNTNAFHSLCTRTAMCVCVRQSINQSKKVRDASITLADCRLIKNLFCCLISVIYLGSDCYARILTYLKDCSVQTLQKCTQKQSYKLSNPLLLETEATLMFVYFW